MEDRIFKDLNDEQVRAVKTIDGAVLILAGAGSGKTKTIVSRLAWLIANGIDPTSTLTLTFTNKAASHMRERAYAMLEQNFYAPPMLCTFHKFGLLFLKFHIKEYLGRENHFIIIDTDDKKRILKSLLDEKSDSSTSVIANEISSYKNFIISPEEALQNATTKEELELSMLYKRYEAHLVENNLVDFDDLLKLPYEILNKHADVCLQTSQRYQYIMVDEYQDTNDIQYKLLQKLTSAHNNLCVVGDDDQSIYGWRGANLRNILDFSQLFKETTVIKLEKNYRSTTNILDAANLLIEHNRDRLGKKLISTLGKGEDVSIFESENETDEASKIAREIKELRSQGVSANEIAILFRVNALSRSIEEGLNRAGLTYRLVGGVRFYDRLEVKDIISYFRLMVNVADDFSFKRVVNRPKRGIGNKTIEKLELAAQQAGFAIATYIQKSDEAKLSALVGKKAKLLKSFVQDIETFDTKGDFIDRFEDTFGLKAFYKTQTDGLDRVSNMDEFYGYFRDYIDNHPERNLAEFLNEVSLYSDQDHLDRENISLMSIHASKGLEFEYLFVIGAEEGFFPIVGEHANLEEERRLAYVAFTRAKRGLYVSSAHSRFYRGKRAKLNRSQFLQEAGLIKGKLKLESSTQFKKGDLVKHKIFGIGRVTGVSKAGREYKLSINFGGHYRDILASFVQRV